MKSEKYGIVTGASRGLGVNMAIELAREGYDVIITYNSNTNKAEAVKNDLIERFGVNVEIFKLQVENVESVKGLYNFAVGNFGEKLHVLINNAGIYRNINLVDMDPDDFGKVIDMNLKGTFNMCHYFAPLMIKQNYGRIINLCSAVGLRGMPGCTAYASSKFGVRGLTQSLACELGPHNITVNAIAPGSHKTDMFYSAPAEVMEERLKSTPLQRVGDVEEMELLVRYFIASNFTTGQVISDNGGTTMI
ncbi:SDR family NAD(P)-dependent oxidoreductase [Clostridium sp. YIM B02555]|uniref:SDR family NAD(P)-dependent oxidoreductase n=1 Tax=Clostridium sp. YIM B02555 TaxID=2911968 RepID=UPI001EEE30F8|nr:SDR family NAD(P)-dependent oxidoreductase [Clostridium sp. YIM B02555]